MNFQAEKEHNYLHRENGRVLKDICHFDPPKAIKGEKKVPQKSVRVSLNYKSKNNNNKKKQKYI